MTTAGETVVFLGPSLPLEQARARLPADYRPPARRGDVYRCLGRGVRRIVLIDGIFHGAPSVWQREILAAIDDGIEVVGTSSMGALRAVELEPYGMVGVGTVFGWYRDGVIDGDDEVALLHGDATSGYRALSEPLVNVRATVARAVAEGAIARDDGERLVTEAKATFYPRRALDPRLRALRVDVKRADAEAALGRCAELPPSARPPLVPGRDRHAGERARVRLVGDASNGEAVHYLAEERGVAARLWPVLARRWYAVQWARERRLACPTEAREAVRVRVERASTAGLARGELETWIDEVALVEWLAREPGLAPGGGDPEARVEAIARDWLRGWGIEGEVPEPDALGFHWERHAALLVELLVSGEARRLLDGAP